MYSKQLDDWECLQRVKLLSSFMLNTFAILSIAYCLILLLSFTEMEPQKIWSDALGDILDNRGMRKHILSSDIVGINVFSILKQKHKELSVSIWLSFYNLFLLLLLYVYRVLTKNNCCVQGFSPSRTTVMWKVFVFSIWVCHQLSKSDHWENELQSFLSNYDGFRHFFFFSIFFSRSSC